MKSGSAANEYSDEKYPLLRIGGTARSGFLQHRRIVRGIFRDVLDGATRDQRGGAENGRMDAEEHPCTGLPVEPDDRLLAVPPLEQVLEHVWIVPVLRYTPPPVWQENAQS